MTYPFHPLAEIFPLMEGEPFNELVADIRAHGLREPIMLYEGKVLDGCNRQRACLEAGREPLFRDYLGDDPLGYVISKNLKRRHLDESQRAMVAAKLATLKLGSNQHSEGPSIEGASRLLNVGHASVERARAVQRDGAPELVQAVERGRVAVSTAANIASLSKDEQRELLANFDSREVIRAANEIRAERYESRRQSRSAAPIPDGIELRIGDCRRVLADVPDNSVALVLTDPPYRAESEPLKVWLAEWTARVLIPGGSLICYTGHWSVNRDTAIFDRHLRFWWQLIMLHGQSRRLPGKFIIANHKPVLWYVKQSRRGNALVPDVLRPSQPEKDHHAWAQGEAGVTNLIELLTDPGELIADPFAGTARWGGIATSLGRRWIGADIAQGGTETVQSAEITEPPADDDGLDVPGFPRREPAP
jgi:ParB-like chromosome segregation protein Spo0J